MIEPSYGSTDFLGPLIGARPRVFTKAAVGVKTGPQTRTPLGGFGKKPRISYRISVEAGELNPSQISSPFTQKVVDYPAKSMTFVAFPEAEAGPKTARKVPKNPRKTGPGPVDRK
jgi:hypothetical protein